MKKQENFLAEFKIKYERKALSAETIKSSSDSYKLFLNIFDKDTIDYHESFFGLFLNHRNASIGFLKLSSGGMTATIVDVRMLFATALNVGATSFIMAHNHPSGTLKPSQADIKLTEKIKEAGKFMDIQLLDHLIVTSDMGYYSFADEE